MIVDKDLGIIKLVKNVRAKRITVRYRDGSFLLTHPPLVTRGYIQEVLEGMKPKLMKLKADHPTKIALSPQSAFETFTFKLHIIEGVSTTNYYTTLKNGILSVACPMGCDYNDDTVQMTLRNIVENAFRFDSKRVFPQKVKSFAQQHGFVFTDVRINKSRTRWGSCSSKKSINLSYFCMLLPEYLVDFVILHELCHTVEMNHGERFWALLDKVSGGKAMAFTHELKSYRTLW